MTLDAAYRECQRITRSRAQNFYYGIRLLPPDKRRAMCAVYAFARRVDDLGDGDLPPAEKSRRLREERAALTSPTQAPDAVHGALADSCARFRLPADALTDLIDGVEMDVDGRSFASFDELVIYCRLVAGSIGRLCVAIFGSRERDRADALADALGVAMQLTNILRDVREDAERGRMYLPVEDRVRFGIDGDLAARPAAAAQLIRYEAARDREWFDRGLELLPLLDARSASCVMAMSGIYRRILGRIEEHPEWVLERRVSLPPWEKAWVTARSLAGVAA